MSKIDAYRAVLTTLDNWDAYLLRESRLPGPRANLELAQAVAEEGDFEHFSHFLTFDDRSAPANTPGEFLAFCGVLGLGKVIAGGRLDRLSQLRSYASDPRWRVREAVAMALQRLGRADLPRLLEEMEAWKTGNWFDKRAVAAGLAEPALLTDAACNVRILDILNEITAAVTQSTDRRSDAFRALRQTLGYCWSVVVAASPQAGRPLMEKWLASPDADIQWIMKENLGKKRLAAVDAGWVGDWQSRLGTTPPRDIAPQN